MFPYYVAYFRIHQTGKPLASKALIILKVLVLRWNLLVRKHLENKDNVFKNLHLFDYMQIGFIGKQTIKFKITDLFLNCIF